MIEGEPIPEPWASLRVRTKPRPDASRAAAAARTAPADAIVRGACDPHEAVAELRTFLAAPEALATPMFLRLDETLAAYRARRRRPRSPWSDAVAEEGLYRLRDRLEDEEAIAARVVALRAHAAAVGRRASLCATELDARVVRGYLERLEEATAFSPGRLDDAAVAAKRVELDGARRLASRIDKALRGR